MRVVAIIQARSGGTRLPGKVLATFGGYTDIEHVYLRTRAACFHTVVAVPAADFKLLRACDSMGIPTFAWDGPEDDVLGRYRAATAAHYDGLVVRITADCPFVQPEHIQAVVALAKLHGFAALGPDAGWPDGLDVEAFHASALTGFTDREHVTKGREPAVWVTCTDDLSRHRWTLDTKADLVWFKRISEAINVKPPFHPTMCELLEAIAREPSLGHYSP